MLESIALKWLSEDKIFPSLYRSSYASPSLYFLESRLSTFFQCILSSFFYVTQNLILLKIINLFSCSIYCTVKKIWPAVLMKHISAYRNPQIQVPLKHLSSHGDDYKDKQDSVSEYAHQDLKFIHIRPWLNSYYTLCAWSMHVFVQLLHSPVILMM